MSAGGEFRQVFHDPDRRRWRHVRRFGAGVTAALSVVFGVLLVSIVVNPALPALGLRPIAGLPAARSVTLRRPEALGARTHALALARLRAAGWRARDPLAAAGHGSRPDTGSVTEPAAALRPAPGYRSRLYAYFVDWDDAAMVSLQQHIGSIDVLVPEWLHVAGPGSPVSVDDTLTQAAVLSYVRVHRPHLPIMPLVNNFDHATASWDSVDLQRTLAAPARRTALASRLLAYVHANGFAGINIDFEGLPAASRSTLTAFVTELSARAHRSGLTVTESVPMDDPAFDYRRLAAAVDRLVLMAYDQHSASTAAGPVAALGWFRSAVGSRLAQLSPGKIVVGLGSYGYDWGPTGAGAPVTFDQALGTAHSTGTTISLDPASLDPHFSYRDATGAPHQVWVLDGVTAFDEIASLAASRPAGYAVWRLGAEDPGLWHTLANRDRLGGGVAEGLEHLDVENSVSYQGSGEVLRVTGTPVTGARDVYFDPALRLITSEVVDHKVRPYIVSRWGGSDPKAVALTFDDGPDPVWTPKILDVLDQKNVHATFFVIGANADAQPDILTRTYDLGEEIGNHTYTHPDVSMIPREELLMQLDATERLLECRLGVRSLLFRPPYAEDVEPDTASQMRPLREVGALGYYTVGMHVDPNDWARPGVNAIVKRTVAQVTGGHGQIVLLHDAGGDRSQTVAALPRIIDELTRRGYHFVTVSQLLGLPRSAVMPPAPRSDRLLVSVDSVGFTLMDWSGLAVWWLFVAGIALGVSRVAVVTALAVVGRARRRARARRGFSPDFRPPVAAIVPAHNEETVIVDSVRSLLASDYPDLRIVVVDDGSTDRTFAVASEAFAGHPRVTVLTKPNGGKAAALEFGIAHADTEIVIGMDADTHFQPDAISKLARHFEDPSVGAVAGNARVGNRVNLLTKWQALEYVTNQNLDRRAFDLLGCITVVPGAIGAWRRTLVERAGGFTGDTLAEDADLTLRMLRLGARIVYEDEAVALTEAPDTVRGFVRQRERWVFGTLQTFWKNRGAAFRPSEGSLGLVAYPMVLLYQIAFPLVSPVMDLVMAGSLAGAWLQRFQHPADPGSEALGVVAFWWALFVLLDMLTAFVAFALERREDWSLLWWVLPQRLFYRQLMYFVVARATLHAVRGSIVGWHRIERKGTVPQTQ